MIGYVVFFSRSFSFFYSSSHSYQILENVIFCSVGLQILILIAAGLQIQQNKANPIELTVSKTKSPYMKSVLCLGK